MVLLCMFFFFKQKTAYEMRISDWSSDVCSSDLGPDRRASETFYGLHTGQYDGATITWAYFVLGFSGAWLFYSGNLLWIETRRKNARKDGEEIGRAACRGRVCQYVEIPVVTVSLKKKNKKHVYTKRQD